MRLTYSAARGAVIALVLPALLASATACGQDSLVDEAGLPDVAVVDTVRGLDMPRLRSLSDKIRLGVEYKDVHSLLIMREGKLVMERYYNESSRADLHTMQSVSKSFTSALVGIAIDEGHLDGVEERVLDSFPEWKEELSEDARRAVMRLEDVLTMRTGNDYHENGPGSPHFELNDLHYGWDRFWLDRPMINDPGGVWRYDSGGVIALSAVLNNRLGQHADRYAERVLFGPLGIEESRWFKNWEDHPHTGGGLSLRAVDMIKLGQLYLQGGLWEGVQVVPEAWVEASIQKHHVFSPPTGFGGRVVGYGYLWWILTPDPNGEGDEEIYAAMGYRGQYIFVIPEHEMVVAVTGWMPVAEYGKPIGFLYSDILPAVVR